MTVDPRIGFGRGFSRYDTSLAKVDSAHVRKVAEWVDGQHGKPFFLFLHTFEVHAPYTRPTYLRGVLPAKRAEKLAKALARLEALPNVSVSALRGMSILQRQHAFERDVVSALYDGGVRAADAWIGELVATLQRSDVYDRTLLVVTSDHGEQLGESSAEFAVRDGRFYNLHGHDLYQEMLHVPLIVKLPRSTGPRRRVSEALVTEGESKSIRDGRYEYILSATPAQVATGGRARIPADPAAAELYDLLRDPGEQRNLLLGADEAVRRRAAVLERELRRVSAGPQGIPERMRPSKELIEDLKALGYVQ